MSGLSASMWTGVSGLQTHSKNMNVIGNNLANVSTLGFKSQRMDFNDYLYLSGSSASGPTQIGAGSGVYALLGDFSQGAFESTNSATDLAIDGNGFFGVRKPNSEQVFYTRAGDFYFNESRELVNPAGLRLQGWAVDNSSKNALTFKNTGAASSASSSKVESAFVGKGTPTDIILDSWNCLPQRTSSVKNILGLVDDISTKDRAKMDGGKNVTLGLFNAWDGRATPPMADSTYAHQSTFTTYDEGGKTHELTIYYDQVNTGTYEENNNTLNYIDNLPKGYKVYEYTVTMNPEEDMRTSDANPPVAFAGTKAAGMLMTGVLIFNASGELVNQSAYTYNGGAIMNGNDIQLTSWSPTKFSSNGLPVFTANWNGVDGANHVWENTGTVPNPNNSVAKDNMIELNLGLTTGGDWALNNVATEGGMGDAVTPPSATQGGAPLTLTDAKPDYQTMCLMKSPETQADATACNQTKSIVDQYCSQNGYGSGILSSYSIDEHGVVYGVYNNNQTLALYQITMYDFHNQQGLRREGGNLYSATSDSGEPRIGAAGDNGFGKTNAYNIENSNVDMTTELVRMISCQRGFQSNSKIVTTVDTMLETVIGMKR